jgi:hypothetical protein
MLQGYMYWSGFKQTLVTSVYSNHIPPIPQDKMAAKKTQLSEFEVGDRVEYHPTMRPTQLLIETKSWQCPAFTFCRRVGEATTQQTAPVWSRRSWLNQDLVRADVLHRLRSHNTDWLRVHYLTFVPLLLFFTSSCSITVEASEEEPRYDIKNDNTGKPAAHKLANIVRKIA